MNRRAFSLVEMLFVISLLGAAGLISARLFTASMHSIDTARTEQNQLASFDHITSVLRSDVWSASSIDVPDVRTLTLSNPDGSHITWRIGDDNISRGAAENSRWPRTVAMEFQRDGDVVALRCGDNDEVRFMSPTITLTAGRR